MGTIAQNQRAGRFVTLEGGDGAGKSTLAARIEAYFKSNHVSYLATREPGGTPIADEIRELLLKPGRKLQPLAELFLFEAARVEHVETVVRPALASGVSVLCDRFTDSTLAFQGYARSMGVELVESLNKLATGGIVPDAVIWLRLDPEAARARMDGRGEKSRIDAEKHEFHQSVFNAFEAIASKNPARFIVLDASRSPDQVFEQLIHHPLWASLFAPGSRT